VYVIILVSSGVFSHCEIKRVFTDPANPNANHRFFPEFYDWLGSQFGGTVEVKPQANLQNLPYSRLADVRRHRMIWILLLLQPLLAFLAVHRSE
jgi:hypothetical protein